MTRRVPVPVSEDNKNYVTLVTGGPLKYYNRRRVRKVFASKSALYKYEPIKAEWFKAIVQELVLARHRRHLSQMALASTIGTSQAEISRIEMGKTNPTVELLDRMFAVLGLEVELTVRQK